MTPNARGRSALTVGVMVMTLIMTGAALWALRSLLEPLALALFLLLMIDGMARALTDRAPWLPSWAALPAAILATLALFGLAIWAITDNARHIIGQAGDYADRLDVLLGKASAKFGVGIPSSFDELWADINPKRYAGTAAEALKGIGEGTLFVLIYLGFLVASRAGFAAKTRRMFASKASRAESERIMDRVRQGVESYIWVQTLVGLIIASASAAIMLVMGLSHALFWAFIIFLASYIPVIGAAIGVLIPPLFGLVEFADPWSSLILLVALELVHFVVSHVLQPRMQGRSLNLDPVVVLFALAFWGLLWGVTGAFLSTPLTVLMMAILAEFPSTRWLAVLLSATASPMTGLMTTAEPPVLEPRADWPWLDGLYAGELLRRGRPGWRYPLTRWWESCLANGWMARWSTSPRRSDAAACSRAGAGSRSRWRWRTVTRCWPVTQRTERRQRDSRIAFSGQDATQWPQAWHWSPSAKNSTSPARDPLPPRKPHGRAAERREEAAGAA